MYKENIPLPRLLLAEIQSLTIDIDLIDDVPEVAADLMKIPALQINEHRNSLVIQRSILDFQYFFHHRL